MNLDRISLYLAGKFSPYYQAPFDKLRLIEIIRDHFWDTFPDDLFKLVDSESFYSMALNKVKRQDEKDATKKLKEIIKILNIPEDAGGLSKKDSRSEKLLELKKEYEELKKMELKKMEKKDAIIRGNQFEKWFIKLLSLFDLDPHHNIKNGVDQIDGSFVIDGQIYIFEIEWTDNKSDKNYVVEVSDKAKNLHGTLGIAVSQKGFKSTVFTKISENDRKNVLLISGKNIEAILNEEIELKDLIIKIKRRGAEKGKPYLD